MPETLNMKTWSICASVLLLVALLAIILASSWESAEQTTPSPDATEVETESARESDERTSAAQPARGELDDSKNSQPEPSARDIQVEITRAGEPAAGWLTWVSGEKPNLLHSRLQTQLDLSNTAAGISHRKHQGSVSIRVPNRHWVWLRATLAQNGRPGPSAFARISPEEITCKVDVQMNTRSIHVLLLESDFRTPAANREVHCHLTDLTTGAAAAEPSTGKTNAYGLVSFVDLSPGAISVCAPGTVPSTPPPATRRFILPEKVPLLEDSCTLVVPAHTLSLRLEVHAQLAPSAGLPPKLFLRRKDDGSGQLFPQQGSLREGQQELEFDLPPGGYEIACLPLYSLRIVSGTGYLLLERDTTHRVQLQANETTTSLELLGLPQRNAFPLKVIPQPADGLVDTRFDLTFLGPHSWHTAKNTVPSIPSPVRLCAIGRLGTWISATKLSIRGAVVRASMQPACYLGVRWFDAPSAAGPYTVVLENGNLSIARVLRCGFSPTLQGPRPALSGEFVVGLGNYRLECRDAEGQMLWSRTVQADKPRMSVEIEGMSGV